MLLVACVPAATEVYWRSDADAARLSRDLTECRVAALRDVPRSVAIRSTPRVTTPEFTTCAEVGDGLRCVTTGGQSFGGHLESYDPDAELRARVEARCMADRGYARLAFPTCTAEQRRQGLLPLRRRLPDERTVACVHDGRYLPAGG
jgi:hypothetical protein